MPSAVHETTGVDHRTLGSIFAPQRKLKVICIGAGASGLLLAYKIQRHFGDFELEVFEKNPEVSDWTANYASSKEIFQYFKDFSTRHQLDKYIQLEHQVVGATWDDKTAQWHVQIKNLKTGEIIDSDCHVLINAGGILNAWRFPPIPGIDKYKGDLVHSAAWPQDLDLTGKTVGLIGNGSSGIQILPAIKDKCKKLVTFIREATWVAPPVGEEYQAFSPEERERFAQDPEHHLSERKTIEKRMNGNFAVFHSESAQQKASKEYMLGLMKQKIKEEKLHKDLIPEWSVGCRRITPGTNYLESLDAENVKVVFGNITSITENAVQCDDGEDAHPVDVLICATGFDTTFKPRFDLTGLGGEKLADNWKGPNCPIGNGPVLISIEAEVEYIIQMLSRFQKENIRSFDIKSEAVEDFNAWKDNYMKDTIWAEECRSWYKAGSAHGKILALWPGSTLHYLEAMRAPRYEDWTFTYPTLKNGWHNRFTYLGNGHSSAEAMQGDLSYYIRNHDDSPIDPVLKSSGEKKTDPVAEGEPVKSGQP
ncbi:MAG: hypothetical protein M1818_003015 [Claussenomyces sp. TS43310]|nr:MAG: hypothetical protein M1818_003015 [Claussenomyces sp. TS43310]